MRLKRLLSFGGSCTFGIAAGGEAGRLGAPLRSAGWTRGRAAAESVRRTGQFIGLEWGLGGSAGLATEKENGRSWTPPAPAQVRGERRVSRAVRWQPGPPPPAGGVRMRGAAGAGRRGGRCWGGELSGVTWRGRGRGGEEKGCGSCTVEPRKSFVWCYDCLVSWPKIMSVISEPDFWDFSPLRNLLVKRGSNPNRWMNLCRPMTYSQRSEGIGQTLT